MIDELISKYPLISEQVDKREVKIVLRELTRALQNSARGSVVEMGCYAGTTSLFIARLLNIQKYTREFHVYDSFEGLPAKRSEDQSRAGEQFVIGELKASKKQFVINFKKAGLPLPFIHKGWFSQLSSSDVPPEVVFAFLDGDYYESIHDSLKLIWPHLVDGAVVVVDDYANEALPGAARAVDEWLDTHSAGLRVENSLAIITPR